MGSFCRKEISILLFFINVASSPWKLIKHLKKMIKWGRRVHPLRNTVWILSSHCFMWVLINSCLTRCNIFLCLITASVSNFTQVFHFIFTLLLDKSFRNEIWWLLFCLTSSSVSPFPYPNVPLSPVSSDSLHGWTLAIMATPWPSPPVSLLCAFT